MISYASVDRKVTDSNGNIIIVMEVEKFSLYSEQRPEDAFEDIPTFMANVPSELFMKSPKEIEEGEVFSVMHENEKVLHVLKCEPKERQKRIQRLRQLEEE